MSPREIRRRPRRIENSLPGCPGCPMHGLQHYTEPVPSFAYGSHKGYDLFIMAEAPGHTEDRRGQPMVGSAGDIQWNLLDYFGITDVAIGNTIRCWTGKGNPDPEERAIRHCLRHVKKDILRIKPRAILLAGKIAARAMLKSKLSLGKLRGWHRLRLSQDFVVDAYVTNHPSAIHYNPDMKSIIESDLLRVVRRLNGEDEVDLDYRFTYLKTLEQVERGVDATLNLRPGKFVGHDWENTDLRLVDAHPLCISWGWRINKKGQPPYYRCLGVPLKHPDTPFSTGDFPQVMKHLQRLFKGLRKRYKEGSIILGAHGAKFENAIDRDVLNVALPQILCTIQAAHAIDENRLKSGFSGGKAGKGGKTRRGIFNLATLSSDWLAIDPEFWDKHTSDLLYSGQGDKTDVKKCTDHCGRDVAVHVALWHEIEKRARQQDYDIHRIRPLLESTPYLLGTMERNGMPVDVNMLAGLRSDKGPLLDRMEQIDKLLHKRPAVQDTIDHIRGGSKVVPLFAKKGQRKGFDIRKRKYLAALFYDVLQLPWGTEKDQQTKTGLPRIDKEFFNAFKDVEEVALVSEWKQLDKLVSTYIEGWWRLVEASPDCRLRASFNAAGTTTGRLSARNPNLQQIPRGKTEAAKILKRVFRPHCNPGDQDLRVIVACDLSQAEVRWLAEVSDEPVLRDMYVKRADMLNDYAIRPSEDLMTKIKLECDLHRSTASEMFGVPILNVTDNNRGSAKCFHPDTEVLTRTGWKKIPELQAGEEVLESYPGRNNQVVFRWTVPLDVFTMDNEFDHLLHFESSGIDLTVTPDHGMVVWDGTKRNMWRRIEATEFSKQRFRSFANAGYLDSTEHRWTSLSDSMLRLAVAVQADGNYSGSGIRFGFTKKRKIERLRLILEELKASNNAFLWSETEQDINGKPGCTFYLKSKLSTRVKSVLEPGSKTFPWSWLGLSEKQRKLVIKEARYWDGHKSKGWKMYLYSNTDRQSVDVLQAIATLTGRKTRLVTKPQDNPVHLTQNTLSIKNHYHTRSGTVKTTKIPYTGRVACLTVPSHCVVVRDGRNNHKQIPVVSHNSINFGLLYGQTEVGLAAQLGIDPKEAKVLLKKWLSRFKRAGEWFEYTESFAQQHGFVESPLGRRRHLDALLLGDIIKSGSALGHLLRVARNAPIQSVASDMNLWIAIKVQKWIDQKKKNWKLMALVHDSIIAEIPIFEVLEYVKIAKTIAESKSLLKEFGVKKLNVPHEMEFDVGTTYGTTKELTTSRLEQEQVVQGIWDEWRREA